MAVLIPQVVTEDRASGAQIIENSLRFDKTKSQYLTRTPGSGGNRKKSTISYWIKRTLPVSKFSPATASVFGVTASGGGSWFDLSYYTVDEIQFVLDAGVASTGMRTQASYRDFSNWYHVCAVLDTDRTNDDGASGRMRVWVNGKETVQKATSSGLPAAGSNTLLNHTRPHYIGRDGRTSSIRYGDNYLAQFYLVDGLVLGPDHFGYYDPLTNVWRPKKFTADGTTINDGRSWSGTSSVTNNNGNNNGAGSLAAVFNGTMTANSSNAYGFTTGAMDFTWTPNTPIPFGSQVRVWTGFSGGTVYLNGDQEVVTTNNNAWTTLINGKSGSIQSIRFVGGSGGGWWSGVEVDGVVLVNSTTQNLDFGTNGVYLPFDGSAPIGQDQSGKGNHYTPINFEGSTSIDKATGAKPILNTVNGGNNIKPGVFGSGENAIYKTTSASNSGGQYVFEGLGTRPNFSFVRGATYTFDWSASSSHPLRFATAADAAGSTEYTDGTSVAGNVTKITVPHDAPDTLYYYCNVHNGMGNSISVTTDETKADPYAWKNVLAIPSYLPNNDVSDQINCNSTKKTLASLGDADVSTNRTIFYGKSYYLDGNGDYIAVTDSADFAYGTGDFTIESWIYPTNVTNYKNFYEGNTNGSTTASVRIQIKNTGVIEYLVDSVGRSSPAVIPANAWTHVALTRASNTVRLFVNGDIVDEYTNNGNLTSQKLHIGKTHDNYYYVGNIQDYRVYKGVAKYTENFIPASTNPSIIPDSPSGVSGSSKLAKNDGGVQFDGAGDALRVADHADLRFGTGAFTIECFVYFNSFDDTYPSIISKYTGGTASWIMRVKNNGKAIFYTAVGGGTNNESSTEPIKLKKWHHIAMVREGTGSNQSKMYVDGQLVVTCTDGTDYTDTQEVTIGAQNASNSNVLNGFMSNVRIIKGTALYTSEFSPPFRALTNVTNTKLLCCQSPTSLTAAAVIPSGSITVAGNPTVTTFNPINTNINTVRGKEGGYCTLNPADGFVSLKDGNLENITSTGWQGIKGSLGMSTGKFYWETQNNQTAAAILGMTDTEAGPFKDGAIFGSTGHGGGDINPAWCWAGANYYFNATSASSGGMANHVVTDVVQYAFDADAGKLWFGRNGVWFSSSWASDGDPASGTNATVSGIDNTKTYVPCGVFSNGGAKFNFGQKPFKFPPPDGFQPITTSTARPITVIARPDQHVGTTLYTGNNTVGREIDMGRKFDLVWVKKRNANENHILVDTVRGANNFLMSDSNNRDNTSGGPITDLKDTSIVVDNNGYVNGNNDTYVAWTWRAGGSKGTFNVDDVGYANASDVNMNVGALNSAQYLKGQVWSGLMSVASGSFDQAATRAFDGFLKGGSDRLRTSDNQATVTMDLSSSPVTVSSQIKVHAEPGYNSSCTVTVGGVSHTSSTGALHTFNVSGSLTEMTLQSTQSGGRTYMEGMEIDGKLLVDDNVTVNSPSVANTGCSVGTKQGFSIVAYNATGSDLRVSHGLSERPGFIILKSKNVSGDWLVWHQSLSSNTHFLKLNVTQNQAQADNVFLSVDQHTFATGDDSGINSGGQQKLAYLWQDVPGLQKFGKWTNNNSIYGAYINLGFKPAIILLKCIDAGEDWYIIDPIRHPYNQPAPSNSAADAVNTLNPNTNHSEATSRGGHTNTTVDILSNGFKIRSTNTAAGEISYGTRNYVYAAWAEAPAFNLYGAQSNAR